MPSKSELYERVYLVKVFHNKELQKRELPELLPQVFNDAKKRVIGYIMRKLYMEGIEITIDNIILFYKSGDVNLQEFVKKYMVPIVSDEDFHTILFDIEADGAADKLFDFAATQTKTEAFGRYLAEASEVIRLHNERKQYGKAVSKAKGIITYFGLLFNPVKDAHRDQHVETMHYVNEDDEYIRTSSQALNTYIGGWSIGYPHSIIAKSSHCKSTWVTYDSVHAILSNKVDTTDIFSMEESAVLYWRRVYAEICGLSTSGMRQKRNKISDEHVKIVKEKLGGKLRVHDDILKYNELLDALQATAPKTKKIVVDHLQAIEYPGKGTFLMNMIGNIPGLIDFEKKLAKKNHIPILNLSQVGDKEIARSDRISKAPRYHDAYASSVLYQASREFLALYYPYKDFEDNPYNYETAPSINDFQISIEKSSYSGTGKVSMFYDPERATFKDAPLSAQMKKANYIAAKEKDIEELTLFEKKKK